MFPLQRLTKCSLLHFQPDGVNFLRVVVAKSWYKFAFDPLSVNEMFVRESAHYSQARKISTHRRTQDAMLTSTIGIQLHPQSYHTDPNVEIEFRSR